MEKAEIDLTMENSCTMIGRLFDKLGLIELTIDNGQLTMKESPAGINKKIFETESFLCIRLIL